MTISGTIITIIVATISSVAVLVVGAIVGFHFLNNRRIEKKRKGKLFFMIYHPAESTESIHTIMSKMMILTNVNYLWICCFLGSNDAKKLVNTLRDSSLNFKYSILEKATGSFDESNKLGQGGFGTVYKVISKSFFS